ncbi:MAG TPA: hypothetical protein VFL83_08775 [Anaeromyxobacter sp.]|nr:hypothetical protein [Anaeromyxobacter sp.]
MKSWPSRAAWTRAIWSTRFSAAESPTVVPARRGARGRTRSSCAS